MDKITQTTRYRQSLILYAQKHGVTKAAVRYRTNRQYIYRWLKRYDGTLASLADRSHRPHSHPNQHTSEEIKIKTICNDLAFVGTRIYLYNVGVQDYKTGITAYKWRSLHVL